MGNINVLSFEVANLIAAGEVVDRPASAIKEMIENSIDAGAKHITVEIQNGGITFMRISDDGCGMDPDDLPLCIKRHATSKIKTAEDLDGICTLGFRGEALAAISAVSKLRIISKTQEAPLGAELIVDCGEEIALQERGCSNGTTIIVEDLFANVPARRKFLKRDVTETAAVSANVEKIALSHPEIAFRLITDGQIKLDTAGDGKLMSAIYAVFGRDFANRLVEVNGEFDGISVKGYIGRSDNVKSNRNYENFYINKRFIKSRTASAAIEQAYVSYMPSEKFPVCVLFISLNPSRVDVNVHPAKLEVKFSNEKPVFEAIYYAVRQALEHNTTRPEFDVKKTTSIGGRVSEAFAPVEREQSLKARQMSFEVVKPSDSSKTAPATASSPINRSQTVKKDFPTDGIQTKDSLTKSETQRNETFLRFTAEQYVKEILPNIGNEGFKDSEPQRAEPVDIKREAEVKSKETAKIDVSVNEPSDVRHEYKPQPIIGLTVKTDNNEGVLKSQPVEKPHIVEQADHAEEIPERAKSIPEVSDKKPVKRNYRIIGEAFNSYVIVELDDRILLVDKHAAHERIIFEDMKQNMETGDVASQLMMIPVEVMLMSDEITAIEEYRAELESVGFEFTCSRNTVLVTAIPSIIEHSAVADMFASVADMIKSSEGGLEYTKSKIFEAALYQASCKAAIKAGREYVSAHIDWIVEKLMSYPEITFCPHGRPVAMEITKSNISRQFGRT